jgi:hypothetical protein
MMPDEYLPSCGSPSSDPCPGTSPSPVSIVSPITGPSLEPHAYIRSMTAVDAAKGLAVYATLNKLAPPVFYDICGDWQKKGLSGVGVFPMDGEDEAGPAVGFLLGRDPCGDQFEIEYFWLAGGLQDSPLASDLFDALMARLPDWVSAISWTIPETDMELIAVCKSCRMRASGLIKYNKGGPDGIIFIRPRMMNLGR